MNIRKAWWEDWLNPDTIITKTTLWRSFLWPNQLWLAFNSEGGKPGRRPRKAENSKSHSLDIAMNLFHLNSWSLRSSFWNISVEDRFFKKHPKNTEGPKSRKKQWSGQSYLQNCHYLYNVCLMVFQGKRLPTVVTSHFCFPGSQRLLFNGFEKTMTWEQLR